MTEAAAYTENWITAQGADIDPESSPLDAHLTANNAQKLSRGSKTARKISPTRSNASSLSKGHPFKTRLQELDNLSV